MKYRKCHLWILIGVCIFETLCVESFDLEKIKRNSKDHPTKFHSLFEKSNSIGDDVSFDIDALLETEMSSLNRLQRKIKNDTSQGVKNEMKSTASKIYNKKHLLHPSKSEEKSHAKRENLFFRLFSDNYKPHKQRSIVKKKRDTNAIIRKFEIINDTNYPSISQSVIPISHFGRDRKINDDNICKTQIIKFFPKQIRKGFENKYDFGNETHRQLLFNDNNNNEWELRQDLFVEEILPLREKNEFGIKDFLHDEAKTIFDDILTIFTMLPFSLFDTIYVKLSTTEKPKISAGNAERSDYDSVYFIDNLRNKRQASAAAVNSATLKPITPVVNVKEISSVGKDNMTATSIVNEVSNTTSEKVQTKEIITNSTSDKVITNTADTSVALTAIQPVSFVNQTNATESEKSKPITNADKSSQHVTATKNEMSKGMENIVSTSTIAGLLKQKLLSPKDLDLLDLNENDIIDRYDENLQLKNVESAEGSEQAGGDRNAFFMILGVIPGLIVLYIVTGLIIAVGVVGIWMIQKNASWIDRNNPGNEPTTSSQANPVIVPCNI